MNRTGSRAFWLLAAGSWLGCGDEAELGPSESAPASPGLVSSTETPGAGDDGDVPPEVALPGPDDAHPTGGQSGTDSGGILDGCIDIVRMPLASDAVQAGERVSWRMANVLRRHILTGSLLGEPVTLEVELEQSGAPMHQLDGSCDVVEVPVRMSVTTVPANGSDVLSVEGREGLLTLRQTWGYAEVKLQEADFSNSERLRAALLGQNTPPAGPAEDIYIHGNVVIYFEFDTNPLARDALTPSSATLYYSGSIASLNGSFEELYSPAVPPSAPPAAECASAEATQDIVFESDEAALSQLVGAWALCNGSPYPGVQILPDGTWQAILPGSEPRLGSGFEREGVVSFKEHLESGEGGASLPLQPSQLEFELSPAWSWATSAGSSAARGGVLDVSASGNTLASGLLVRLATTIEPAVAPLFARAERAGAAGCASTETEIEAHATSAEELLERLRGRWVGCSGFSGELSFDAEGNLHISSERHQDITEHLLVEPRSDGSYGIATSSQTLNVVLSAHPIKLQITDVNVGQPLVFSALP